MNHLRQRADVINYSIMAEINQFHESRSESFKHMMEHYLEQQIQFYSTVGVLLDLIVLCRPSRSFINFQIVDNLKGSLAHYRNM